jgi:hypothetical protein
MTDMLAERKGFSWLGKVDQSEREAFWDGWRKILCDANVIGISCVIDRPGYVARGYLEKHNDRWLLCRSAFDITVERAAKIARSEGRKLHVVFEQDAAINKTIEGYFDNLKENGLAFDGNNSKKYVPLAQPEFAETLGRIQHKPKTHPLLQVADSYIYAMARHGYDKKFWIHRSLRDRRRLSDFAINSEVLPNVGIKYYCFD